MALDRRFDTILGFWRWPVWPVSVHLFYYPWSFFCDRFFWDRDLTRDLGSPGPPIPRRMGEVKGTQSLYPTDYICQICGMTVSIMDTTAFLVL